MAVEGEITVIGPGARLEGAIVSAGSLRIDGTIKGKINADGDVILSPQANVEADIQAENVTVSGRLQGNVLATGKAEVGRGGRIDGDVTTRVLVIHEGGFFNGQSIMDQQAQRILQGQQAQAQPSSEQQQAPSPSGPHAANRPQSSPEQSAGAPVR
jgi:cytoskeletal protein CcmA (bactofilin family)